jgi:hypothetical protein
MSAFTVIRLLMAFAQLLVLGGNIARAQTAEPLRVEFRSGSHVAVVTGTLTGRQQMEYVTAIRKDQHVTLALASDSPEKLNVRLRDPQYADVVLLGAGSRRWTATVAETGDYEIWVVRINNIAGQSSYKLRITVR